MDTLIVAAILVVVLGSVAGFVLELGRHHSSTGRAVPRPDGSQEITVRVQHGYHPDRIELAAGVPAILRFDRREEDPCSEILVSELFASEYRLAPDAETVVRFTPDRPGTYAFTCGLGMYSGSLVVRPMPSR